MPFRRHFASVNSAVNSAGAAQIQPSKPMWQRGGKAKSGNSISNFLVVARAFGAYNFAIPIALTRSQYRWFCCATYEAAAKQKRKKAVEEVQHRMRGILREQEEQLNRCFSM